MKKEIDPNCELCHVKMCNSSPAGKVIPTDGYGDKFICISCCKEIEYSNYVIVEKEKIKK